MRETGFSKNIKEVENIWKHNAQRWPSLCSPWRPSQKDIEIYEQMCGTKLKGNILILGATPELRDLVAQTSLSRSPVLVDISTAMLIKASELLHTAKPENEIWIKSDWCEVPLPESSFDVILGDMVWWVISISQQLAVRDTLTRLLKKDGLFISRFRFHNPMRLKQNPFHIIKEYTQKLNRDTSSSLICNAMLSALYDAATDIERKQISRERVRTYLLQAVEQITNSVERDFIFDAIQNIIGADWTAQNRQEITAMLEEGFDLVDERYADDYEAEYYPILKFARHEEAN